MHRQSPHNNKWLIKDDTIELIWQHAEYAPPSSSCKRARSNCSAKGLSCTALCECTDCTNMPKPADDAAVGGGESEDDGNNEGDDGDTGYL